MDTLPSSRKPVLLQFASIACACPLDHRCFSGPGDVLRGTDQVKLDSCQNIQSFYPRSGMRTLTCERIRRLFLYKLSKYSTTLFPSQRYATLSTRDHCKVSTRFQCIKLHPRNLWVTADFLHLCRQRMTVPRPGGSTSLGHRSCSA